MGGLVSGMPLNPSDLSSFAQNPFLATEVRRVQDRFKAGLTADIADLAASTEAAVVRRAWCTDEAYSAVPLYHELNRFPRGTVLASEPNRKHRKYLIGWDRAGDLRLSRTWHGDEVDAPRTSRYVMHDAQARLVSHWLIDERVASGAVGQRTPRAYGELFWVSDDVRLAITVAGPKNWSAYAYVHEQERIQRVAMATHPFPHTTLFELEYDPDGLIARITAGGKPFYEAPRRTLDSVLRALKTELIGAVPSAVAAAVPRDVRIYALALAFDPGSPDEFLPPVLWAAPEANRAHFLAAARGPDLEAIWEPDAGEGPVTIEYPIAGLDDDLMLADGREATILMRDADPQPGIEMLVSVAKDLNKLDWSTHASVTDDFVVYPVERGAPWHAHLAKAVPKGRLKLLRERGFVPGDV